MKKYLIFLFLSFIFTPFAAQAYAGDDFKAEAAGAYFALDMLGRSSAPALHQRQTRFLDYDETYDEDADFAKKSVYPYFAASYLRGKTEFSDAAVSNSYKDISVGLNSRELSGWDEDFLSAGFSFGYQEARSEYGSASGKVSGLRLGGNLQYYSYYLFAALNGQAAVLSSKEFSGEGSDFGQAYFTEVMFGAHTETSEDGWTFFPLLSAGYGAVRAKGNNLETLCLTQLKLSFKAIKQINEENQFFAEAEGVKPLLKQTYKKPFAEADMKTYFRVNFGYARANGFGIILTGGLGSVRQFGVLLKVF